MADEKSTSKLIEMFRSDESIERMAQVWRDGLQATKIHRLTGESVPDHRTRREFLSLGMAYGIGLPVQRQEVHSVQWNGLKEIRARLKEGGWLTDSDDAMPALKNRAGAPPSEEYANDESID